MRGRVSLRCLIGAGGAVVAARGGATVGLIVGQEAKGAFLLDDFGGGALESPFFHFVVFAHLALYVVTLAYKRYREPQHEQGGKNYCYQYCNKCCHKLKFYTKIQNPIVVQTTPAGKPNIRLGHFRLSRNSKAKSFRLSNIVIRI